MTKFKTNQGSQICFCFLTNIQADGDLITFLRESFEFELVEIEQGEDLQIEISQTENPNHLEIQKKMSEVSKNMTEIGKLIKLERRKLLEEQYEGKFRNKSDLFNLEVEFYDIKKKAIEKRLNSLNTVETKSKIEDKEIEILNKFIEYKEIIEFFKITINSKSDFNYNDFIEEIQKEHKNLIQLFKKITNEAKYQILITSCIDYKFLKQNYKLKGDLAKTFNYQIFSNSLKKEIGDPSISKIAMNIRDSKYNLVKLSLEIEEEDLIISTRSSLICEELSIENLLEKYYEILNILIERNEVGKYGKM